MGGWEATLPGRSGSWVAYKTRNPEGRARTLRGWDEGGSKTLLVALALGKNVEVGLGVESAERGTTASQTSRARAEMEFGLSGQPGAPSMHASSVCVFDVYEMPGKARCRHAEKNVGTERSHVPFRIGGRNQTQPNTRRNTVGRDGYHAGRGTWIRNLGFHHCFQMVTNVSYLFNL